LDLISELGFHMPTDREIRFNIANRVADDHLTFGD
jgi:hypothetical protein